MSLCLACPIRGQEPPAAKLPAPTLADLYSELDIVDAALSTSGRYLAAILRNPTHDMLLVVDLTTGEKQYLQKTGAAELGRDLLLRMSTVYWKSDDRILLRLRVRPADPDNSRTISLKKIGRLGDRLFAINRANGQAVAMLGDNRNRALEGAFDRGAILSFLPADPAHILMVIDGFEGRSLFKVNLDSGHGEQIERPAESVIGWWLDVDGNPVVRVTLSSGTIRLFRKDEQMRWRQFYKMRTSEMRDRAEYSSVGPSDQPGKYYVLARPPGRDRMGLYLYDLDKEVFGEPIVEHPLYDLESARVSRDGKQVLRHCHVAHVRVCEFTDAKLNAHMRGLRKFFQESANVYIYDSSDDGNTILLYVEGPHDPPGYYYYLTEKRDIQAVGLAQRSLGKVTLPRASVVHWKSRDGVDLSGYLTLPSGAPAQKGKLPLIVYPHGGPELRDHLTFDPWVQFWAARGYAVFQPNFRGSDGFGRAFAESGYGEWGGRMQNDIVDGVRSLISQETADESRLCIIGASFGGYAALAGVALTPGLFKCAVSVAGVSDLDDFIGWRKRNWGSDSAGYTYWLRSIGDPDREEKKLHAVSPLRLVQAITVPVLLIHGVDDGVVPIAQSRALKKALEKIGKPTELLELAGEGHSYWAPESDRLALSTIDAFLWKHLGPGHGISTPPAPGAKQP